MTERPVEPQLLHHEHVADDDAMPRVVVTRRSALLGGFFVLSVVAFLYFGLPQITGLGETWRRIDDGDPIWLLVAGLLAVLSFVGNIWLFRVTFVREGTDVTWRESYEITLAGVAATRLFSAAGAGGLALTAWAMRRRGLERRIVAIRLFAFLVLLYAVYDLALVIGGFGLYLGVFPGRAPFGITLIPAVFGLVAFAATLLVALVPHDFGEDLKQFSEHHGGQTARILARIASVPASFGAGVRVALKIVRDGEVGMLGALLWWAGNVGALWACFHAFGGEQPPIAVIVVAFFVGMLANTLPFPGGVGGVDGGRIGAFAAFDVDFGHATVAVLGYRAFSFWLPTIPGAVAYLQLRRTVSRWRDEPPTLSPAVTA